MGKASLAPKRMDFEAKLLMTTTRINSPWITFFKPNPQAKLRLFCFPYAGSGANIYRNWPDKLPADIEVCPIQLPGRGSRLKEPPFTHMIPLVEALAAALYPFLNKSFAFFGHSMGAMISYELACLLRRRHVIEPAHLFVSGRRAPQLPDSTRTYDLPEGEFIQKLREIKGTPQEVLDHQELMRLMLPLLRADFEVCQTYVYKQELPLSCGITAFGGAEDEEETRGVLEEWRARTSGSFTIWMLPGDHFFLHTSEELLLQMLTRELHTIVQKLA